MIASAFWLAVAVLFYAYIGYPALITILATLRPRTIDKKNFTPRISMIIPVYNEEAVIRQKIENSLAIHYPQEKLQIIVVSDCSTDATPEIVSEYANQGVLLLELPQRRGKTAAQNMAIARAEGDIIVLSDASIMLEKRALRQMMGNFHDRTIGCVSGEDRSVNFNENCPGESEGFYVRYEMLIRRLETKLDSIVGASGCFYAVRKELCPSLEESMPHDLTTPLYVKEHGFRSISDPQAVAYVRTVASPRAEFPRRVRTATRGLQGLFAKSHLLNPCRYGLFAFMLISHKLLRFLVPFFLIGLMISNVLLITEPLYRVLAILQGTFYGLAWLGYITAGRKRQPKFLSFPYYFVMVNLAILIAWWRFLRGTQDAVWAPSKRHNHLVSQ